MIRPAQTNAPEFTVSVSRLANYLLRKLNGDRKLRRLGVSGEISGYTVQPNGTIYFDLKDRDALIKCVAWSEAAAMLPPLANGQAVVAVGSVGLYAKKGNYQLTVYAVEPEGAGRLHAVYEALKRRLDAQGLFAESRKRPLPAYPFRVALVSSRTANGAGDFITQAAALAPHVTIELFETPMQGDNSAPEIVRALERASRADVDLVVLARGGGSFEDLFVFNDERVVRALARCAHPTVSAIGHEADAPLTDFVADRREATPSSAAQNVLPRRADALRSIAACAATLDRSVARNLSRHRDELKRIDVRSPLASPERMLHPRRQAVDAAQNELERTIEQDLRRRHAAVARLKVRLEACNPSVRLGARRQRFALLSYRLERSAREVVAADGRRYESARKRLLPSINATIIRARAKVAFSAALLDARNPTKILERGYAIVTVDGVAVRDAVTVPIGALVTAQLARGRLAARVESRDGDGGY